MPAAEVVPEETVATRRSGSLRAGTFRMGASEKSLCSISASKRLVPRPETFARFLVSRKGPLFGVSEARQWPSRDHGLWPSGQLSQYKRFRENLPRLERLEVRTQCPCRQLVGDGEETQGQ